MNTLKEMYDSIIENMGVPGLNIFMSAVKIYRGNDPVPKEVLNLQPKGLTLTSCQANRQASLGDVVCLTRQSIGCVAAAITFGMVDKNQDTPMEGSRVYTDIMKQQSGKQDAFAPPTPRDFTEGNVYACHGEDKQDFALFGKNDSGRYKTKEIAQKAIKDMMAIEPADTTAVFFYSPEFEDFYIEPDVVIFNVRPVELTRLIQAYQYNTGKRIVASMGGLRVMNSDLIVRPYLTGEINVSTYCLGARLIGQYEADRLGMGVPFKDFKIIVQGMKDSRTGFPFHLYPGADENEV